MAIPIPTVDDFQESTVMTIIREILDYICGDTGLVDAINDNDIASFNSSYTNNVLKIDAVKGDGSIIPVCNVTIEGGSSTTSPYPTGVTITLVGTTLNFSMAMSFGAPITTSVDLSTTFASKTELMNTPQNVVGAVTTARNGLMIASDKSKLDDIQAGANNYVLPIGGTAIGGVKNGGNVTIEADGVMNYTGGSAGTKSKYVIYKYASSTPLSINGATIKTGSGTHYTYDKLLTYEINGITSIGSTSSQEVPKFAIYDYKEEGSTESLNWTLDGNVWNNVGICSISVVDYEQHTVTSIDDNTKYYKIHNMSMYDGNMATEGNSPYIDIILHEGQAKVNANIHNSNSFIGFVFSSFTYIEEFDSDPGF